MNSESSGDFLDDVSLIHNVTFQTRKGIPTTICYNYGEALGE